MYFRQAIQSAGSRRGLRIPSETKFYVERSNKTLQRGLKLILRGDFSTKFQFNFGEENITIWDARVKERRKFYRNKSGIRCRASVGDFRLDEKIKIKILSNYLRVYLSLHFIRLLHTEFHFALRKRKIANKRVNASFPVVSATIRWFTARKIPGDLAQGVASFSISDGENVVSSLIYRNIPPLAKTRFVI